MSFQNPHRCARRNAEKPDWTPGTEGRVQRLALGDYSGYSDVAVYRKRQRERRNLPGWSYEHDCAASHDTVAAWILEMPHPSQSLRTLFPLLLPPVWAVWVLSQFVLQHVVVIFAACSAASEMFAFK